MTEHLKPKRRGRPAKTDDTKAKRFCVMLTPSEIEHLEILARQIGLTASRKIAALIEQDFQIASAQGQLERKEASATTKARQEGAYKARLTKHYKKSHI